MPRSFQKNSVCETGLPDFHKLIFIILKSTCKKLPPKQINYGTHKSFNETKTCHNLHQELLKGEMYSHDILLYLYIIL